MIKRWLTKLKMLLNQTEKVENKYEPREQMRNQHNIQAKIKYQYPEKRAFRFPIISDELEKSETRKQVKYREEKPAYQRRERESIKKEKEIVSHGERSQNRKIYKPENAPPFELSQVPSPVYGFQKKNKVEEVEQVPAYQRKKAKSNENV